MKSQTLMSVLIEQRNGMEAKQFGRWFTSNMKQLIALEQMVISNYAMGAVQEFKEKLTNAAAEPVSETVADEQAE
jgi:hypothetical protein